MSRKNIFPALISFMAVVEVTLAAARTSYKAAVYAHAPIIPPYTPVSIGREKALGNMEKNLAVYRLQATEAKNQVYLNDTQLQTCFFFFSCCQSITKSTLYYNVLNVVLGKL